MKLTILVISLFCFSLSGSNDDDWPQFRGRNRDGIAHSVTQLKPWPPDGPALMWQIDLGAGFSGISVSGNRVFTMYADGKSEFLAGFELETGKEVWRIKVDDMLKNQHGNGPRSTPAVDEQRVYGLSSRGHLIAVEKKTGKLQWEASCDDFGGGQPFHGFSSSPLVEENMLLLQTEAGKGKALVAFDKRTGQVLWTAGHGGDGDCSPTSFVLNGERQFLFEEIWSNNVLKDSFNSPVYFNDYLYGFSGAFLVCVDFATGKRKWAQRGFGEGALVLADGHLLVLGDRGNLALVKASPEKYDELSNFQALRGKCWTTPTVAQGKLLLRNQEKMACYNLRE